MLLASKGEGDTIPIPPWRGSGRAARPEFCNASGHIQGGLLSAMLDDTMGPAVLIATDAARLPVTIGMTVTFLAPAKPGVIYGRGRVRQLGKSIGYLEAHLENEDAVVLAHATSSVRLVRFDVGAAG